MVYLAYYRLVFFIGLIFIGGTASGQKIAIEIINKSKIQHRRLYNGIFQLIPAFVDASDTNSCRFIATIRATAKKKLSNNISDLRNKLQDMSQKIGANSFRLNSYQLNEASNITTMTLDVYLCSDSVLKIPSVTKDTNRIIIFPPLMNAGKNFRLRFNHKIVELGEREYFVYHITPGERVAIGGEILSDKNKEIVFRKDDITSRFFEYSREFNPFSASVTDFHEFTEDYAMFLISTYYTRAKTCSNCGLEK